MSSICYIRLRSGTRLPSPQAVADLRLHTFFPGARATALRPPASASTGMWSLLAKWFGRPRATIDFDLQVQLCMDLTTMPVNDATVEAKLPLGEVQR